MVTYLMSVGYDSTQIGIARTLSVGFEVLSTWVAPWLMGRIGPIRAGLWLASWQIICLVAGTSVFWAFAGRPIVSASGLIGGTILSRVGLRGFDLCAQILVQEVSFPNLSAAQLDCDCICFYLDAWSWSLSLIQDVEPSHRGSFSAVEAAWQNVFEICSFISTIIFSRPEQFKYPTLLSVIAVVIAGALYTTFVYLRRGHLVHLPHFSWSSEAKQRSRERGLERIASSCEVW